MTPDDLKCLIALRHHLHRHPDVSGQEGETARFIAAQLHEIGADQVVSGVGGHGVLGVIDSGQSGPVIGVRCELDALPIQEDSAETYRSQTPGQAHLCGHDGHMVMVLGVAQRLAARRPVRGRVLLMFQPAEETGKGAAAYRDDPAFARHAPDMVVSLHNLPGLALGAVDLCRGPANCASRGMRISLSGKTSHAAAPQDGLSPAKAVADLMTHLPALAAGGALDEAYALITLTHARLGEPTFGIAPGQGAVWVTLRTVTNTRMAQLVDQVTAVAKRTAAHHGLDLSVSFDDIFEACVNHPEAVSVLSKACAQAGVPVAFRDTPQRFSEDFGQFSQVAKTAMFWLGAGQEHPQLHNPDYDFPDALIPIGVEVFDRALRQLTG